MHYFACVKGKMSIVAICSNHTEDMDILIFIKEPENILAQATQSMLANSNNNIKNILQLLG